MVRSGDEGSFLTMILGAGGPRALLADLRLDEVDEEEEEGVLEVGFVLVVGDMEVVAGGEAEEGEEAAAAVLAKERVGVVKDIRER